MIPAAALEPIAAVLASVADGDELCLAPADLQVGTEEIARVLGVSHRWAAELIDRGVLEGTKNGSKRRASVKSLAAYRAVSR